MNAEPEREVPPTRAEFVEEVIGALRAAGLEGAIDYDDTLGAVMHGSGLTLGVHDLYEKMGTAPRENRLPTLANVARGLVNLRPLPERWEGIRDAILPEVKRRMELAVEALRRPRKDDAATSRPVSEITPHLVFEIVYPQERGVSIGIPAGRYAAWGVEIEEAFRTAGRNLARRTQGQWQVTAEAPGMVRSPWRDGFDASRIFLPQVFGSAPLRGWPVAVAPLPTMLLAAGSEDEGGLVSLAGFAQKMFERHRRFFVLRPLRMGSDGESWEEWLPPEGHPARNGLRTLQAIEEKADYDRQDAEQRKLAGAKAAPLPPLLLLRTALGATVTMTPWTDGGPVALPKADVILFRRGKEVLGFAPWEKVAEALPNELKPLPSYPVRHLAADFPEPWQLDAIDLQPWQGPPAP